jgi:hypothetical protein
MNKMQEFSVKRAQNFLLQRKTVSPAWQRCSNAGKKNLFTLHFK